MPGDEKRPVSIFLDPPIADSKSRVRAASVTMLRQSRRLLWRSRNLIISGLAIVFVFWLWINTSGGGGGGYNVIPWSVDFTGSSLGADSSDGLLRPHKGKPKSKDYNDVLARWLFSKEWNETGL